MKHMGTILTVFGIIIVAVVVVATLRHTGVIGAGYAVSFWVKP